MPKLDLYYFDIPGKAEAIRLAFTYGNVPFTDHRLSRAEFEAMRDTGKLPFGQLPVLCVDDTEYLSQSAAITRYVGKLTGLYPTDNDILAAKIDAIVDSENDLFMGLTVSRYRERYGFGVLDDSTVAVIRKNLNDEVLPRHLRNFDSLLNRSSSSWLAGGATPTIADFILSVRLKWLVSANDGISPDLLNSYPKICSMIEAFDNLPAIKSYYSK